MLSSWRPMPLVRAPEAFDHPDWVFELKHDGFRTLAVVDRHRTQFFSRRGREFTQWWQLEEEVAQGTARRPRGP